MSINSKKDLKRYWALVEPKLVLPDLVKITDTEYSFGFDKHTYIAVELNKLRVFFVFDIEDDSVVLFSHDVLPLVIVEQALVIRHALVRLVYPSQMKAAKASKYE